MTPYLVALPSSKPRVVPVSDGPHSYGLTRRMERHSIGDNTPEDVDQYNNGGDETFSHLRAYQDDGGYYYVEGAGNRFEGEGEGYFQSDYHEGDDYYPEANDTEESYYDYDNYDYPPEQPVPRQNPAGNRNANVNKLSMNYDPHQGAYAKNPNSSSKPHKPAELNNEKKRDIYRDIMKKLNETADALKNARVGEPLISSVPNLDYIQRHRNAKLESLRKMENRPPLRRDPGREFMASDNNDFLTGKNIDKKAMSEMDHRKLFGGQNQEARVNQFSSDSKIPPDVHARYNRNNMNMMVENDKIHQNTENSKIEKSFNQSAGTCDRAPKTFLQKVQESVARVNQSNMNFDT